MKKLIILFWLILLSLHVYSQSGLPSLPVVTAQSPTATMMNRYGKYPVNLYTGLVDITIPIHEININGIKVPITFRYHASGLKFDDLPMELGYGWTLMAGGTISRSFRGAPDGRSFSGSGSRAPNFGWIKNISDIDKPQNTTSAAPDDTDQKRLLFHLKGVEYPWRYDHISYYDDSEYDVFDYYFLHHSGQTYFLDGYTINVPANGLNMGSTLSNPKTVIDNEGIHYTFTLMDYDSNSFNEVWYLTQIISANKADTVKFEYTTFVRNSNNAISKPVIDQYFEHKNVVYYGGVQDNIFTTTGPGKTYKFYYPPRLSSIKYREGKVEFTYTGVTTSRSLSEIKIYDHGNVLFRTVKLLKPRTDWLDGIEFYDKANVKQQTYGFEYNGTPATTAGIDYWGYYNGRTLTYANNYIPNLSFTYWSSTGPYTYTIMGLNRTPDFSSMQAGSLKKIIYPTKGYTIFEYEAHKANNLTYGGLRIKEVRNYNHDNTLVERKWYKYGTNESDNGRAVTPLDYSNHNNILSLFRREAFTMENRYDGHNSRFYYKYFYPFPLTAYFASGSTVVYPEVSEYSGTGSVSNGKTIYKYTDTADESFASFRGMTQPQKYRTYHWKNGLLLSKEVYNSNIQKIYSLSNNYSSMLTSETMNLRVMPFADLFDVNGPTFNSEDVKHQLHINWSIFGEFSSAISQTLMDYSNYYITTGMAVLSSSVEYKDGVTTNTTYPDYNNIGLPRQVQVTNSNGDNLITKYKYPGDLSTTAPYNSMVNSNILTPVIQQEEYKGATLLSKSVNEYKSWGNNMFELEILKLQPTSGSSLENRITYHSRDPRGNPRYISKDGADHVVYLWGYNSMYPIAKIEGVPYSDVTAKISEPALNTIAAKAEPAPADWTTINNLRSQLTNALVTTYTYYPLIGVKTMTDPRNVVTTYNYDNFGRLINVVRNGRTIEAYNYNYKN